ncbi:hypothetical protein LTS17_003217 [Exophiala oligosperma]
MGSLGAEKIVSLKDTNTLLFESLPASLPHTRLPDDVGIDAVATAGVALLDTLHENQSDLIDGVVWRDLCALTGTFRTFYGVQRVWSVWNKLSRTHQPCNFKVIPGTAEVVHAGDSSSWIMTAYEFECRGDPATKCSGFVGLVPDPASPSQWKIWMFTTLLEELIGFPNPDVAAAPKTKTNGVITNGDSSHHTAGEDDDFQVVVVGAGFSGLAVAGRLHAMGIKVVVIERNPELGDNWKNRYESARFHTTKEYSDFPLGRLFAPEDAKFPGRLDLVRLYKKYVKRHGLDVRCSSSLQNASYETEDNLWTLDIQSFGDTIRFRTRHLVLAIGGLGAIPNMPKLPNRDLFKGEVMHSFDYRSARAWKGKVGVVVGSANTAHDVAEDMVDAGLSSVTLVQRSPTPVFPIEWYKELMDAHYTASSDLEFADRRTISLPVAISRLIGVEYYKGRMAREPERLNALEQAGFAIEKSGDMVKCAFGDGAGGHHTDVGGGAKIVAGQIKVKSPATVTEFTPTGLRFADGSELEAGAIVFCTGFHTNMLPEAVKVLGTSMKSQLENFWGIDQEGELRGAFKKMKQPGVWFIGGGAPWARFGSRFLALQIQSDLVGRPLKTYTTHQQDL